MERIHQRLKHGPKPDPDPEPQPAPSCVSFKSDQSKDIPIKFKGEQCPAVKRIHQRLKHGPGPDPDPDPEPRPAPSCVSFKSDHSQDFPIKFKGEQCPAVKRMKLEEQDSPEPEPDSVSMTTGYTRKHPYNLRKRRRSVDRSTLSHTPSQTHPYWELPSTTSHWLWVSCSRALQQGGIRLHEGAAGSFWDETKQS